MHQPADALVTPRFTGPRTFARLPHVTDFADVDVAIFGMPWDGATTYRTGARFGPEGVRSASVMLRPYNPVQDVMVFGNLSCIDYGDAPTVPGYVADSLERIEAFVRPIAEAGAIGVGIGGDHSVTLAELRATAAVHGPLGLVHLDSHGDIWESYFGRPYNHGTLFRRALEEGLIDPARSLQAGMRGSLYGPDDLAMHEALGIEMLTWQELALLTPGAYADRVRGRVGDGPAFFTFDIDFVDPSYAPATGTPEVGGPTSYQALELVRALTGIDFRGFDVVEVSPAYDGPGQATSLIAANVIYEMLSLIAISRR
jgi:agmatinase